MHMEATMTNDKVHVTNRKNCLVISEQNHPYFFDDIHAHASNVCVQKNQLFFLAYLRDRTQFDILSLLLISALKF